MRGAVAISVLTALLGACIYDWTVPEPQGTSASTSTPTSGGGGQGAQGGAIGGMSPGGGGQGATGGGGGTPAACRPDGNDTACESCAKDQCCPEVEACYGDISCQCWIACIYLGGDCQGTCGNPSATTSALIDCALDHCGAFC
jgi:hypothetical protein